MTYKRVVLLIPVVKKKKSQRFNPDHNNRLILRLLFLYTVVFLKKFTDDVMNLSSPVKSIPKDKRAGVEITIEKFFAPISSAGLSKTSPKTFPLTVITI